jgi:PhzF family phenazine biosynthesis protein
MTIDLYQIDAFTDRRFHGNPAAICPLDAWLDDTTLQAIALENNLSETAFIIPGDDAYELRWFTPAVEVDLCGHATLASAHVVFNYLEPARNEVTFSTRSGLLAVHRMGERLSMNFPAMKAQPCDITESLVTALGIRPEALYKSRDYLAVFDSEATVLSIAPDMALLKAAAKFGVIVTAPGDTVDFVSRFFAPNAGVPEDPVTGSAHCTLVPYWAERLGKAQLHARQVSRRGGDLYCEDQGERVQISGHAVTYLKGKIEV